MKVLNIQTNTINKPGGEPGGISGRIAKNSCITPDMNLLPQSRRILLCCSASLVGVPRPNAYSLRSLARGGYKQTPRLPVPDQTLIPDPYRQQGWQSQTKRLSPHHYPAVAPSRRQGWKCPRLNAYPTDPSRHQGWE